MRHTPIKAYGPTAAILISLGVGLVVITSRTCTPVSDTTVRALQPVRLSVPGDAGSAAAPEAGPAAAEARPAPAGASGPAPAGASGPAPAGASGPQPGANSAVLLPVNSSQGPLASTSFSHLTIWSTDLHITPIADIKHLLYYYGVRVIDKSLSGHCRLHNTCATDLKVLTPINVRDYGNGGEDPVPISRQLFDAYKNDTEFSTVNAVVCLLPIMSCQMYLPLNRSVIMIAVVRYEDGQEPAHLWTRFNKLIQQLASNPRHFIGANSRYDAEYIKYFTGVDAVYVPSHCGHIKARYNPTKPEVLLARSHIPGMPCCVWRYALEQIQAAQARNASCAGSKGHLKVVGLDDVYPGHYEYEQLAAHPAIIHFPYTVSVMSFFEHYRMGVPLFVPSVDFMVELHLAHNLLSERTWVRLRTGVIPNGSVVPKHPSYPVDHDPNNDVDPEAMRYWFQFADFYVLPHVQQFSSFDDLACKLANTDFAEVSRLMKQFNIRQEAYLLDLWKDILKRIDTGPPVTPPMYESVASIYNMV